LTNKSEYFQLIKLSDFGDNDYRSIGVFDPDTFTINYDMSLDNCKSKTYDYDELLSAKTIDYGGLYCGGKTILDMFKENPELNNLFYDQYISTLDEIKKYLKIYSKVRDKRELVVNNIIPNKLLVLYYNIKNSITRYIFENYNKPQNYDLLQQSNILLGDIRNRELKLDQVRTVRHKIKGQNLHKLNSIGEYGDSTNLHYNLFGTVTGRLKTAPKTFPIMGLNKEYRDIVVPSNDMFVELDYKGADVQTFLYLFDSEHSDVYEKYEDIYDFFRDKFFGDAKNRDEVKQKTFELLYDKRDNYFLTHLPINKILRGMSVLENDTEVILRNPYGHEMELSKEGDFVKHKKISYMIQSTTNCNMLQSAININDYLKSNCVKSKVAFMIHDSVIVDWDEGEFVNHFDVVQSIFESTKLGKYNFNVSMGKNFKDMEKVE